LQSQPVRAGGSICSITVEVLGCRDRGSEPVHSTGGGQMNRPHPGTSLPRAIILEPNDGCLSIARALVRRGIDVYALTNHEYAYVLASRGVRGRVMPPPNRDPERWLATLHELADQGGGIVLSGSDRATEWLATKRSALPESLRTFEATGGAHTRLMDKASLYRRAETLGINVPKQRHVRDRTDMETVLPEVAYPSVVKASLGHVAKPLVGFGTVFVNNPTEFAARAEMLLDHGIDFLVTQQIPGPETRLECSVHVRLADGTYALEYGRRKIRQWPPDTGVGSLAVTAPVPETIAMGRRLLDDAGFHGIAATETKVHEETNEVFLIEVNVRVPALFGLADASGVDGSWRLYATLAGLPLEEQPAQIDGRKVMIPHREVRAASYRIRRGDATIASVLRSWRKTGDHGVLSIRDPLPSLAFLGHRVRRQITRHVPRLAGLSRSVAPGSGASRKPVARSRRVPAEER
jgi:D-aspartate ligase